MASSVAITPANLPHKCANQPVMSDNDVGTCTGGAKISAGIATSALECWEKCWNVLGDQLWYSCRIIFL